MVKKAPSVDKNSRSRYTENRKGVWDMEICTEGLEQE